MAAAGEEAEKKAVDARIQWIRGRLLSSLRCKDAVLDKLFAHEDSAAAIASFIDTSDCNRLLVYDAGKGELAAVRRSSTRARCADPTLTYSDSRAAPASPRCRRAS